MTKKQKSNKQGKNSGEPVYIKLYKPLFLRKVVLSAALDSARILKSYEELKSVKETKKHLIESLGELKCEILNLTKKLEKELPEVRFHEEIHETVHLEVEEKKEVKAQDSEIERLKAELESIEKKIAGL